MIIMNRPPTLGNIGLIAAGAGIIDSVKTFLSPKQGRIIEVPGTPAALNMSVVAILGAAVLAVAVMKKKRVL